MNLPKIKNRKRNLIFAFLLLISFIFYLLIFKTAIFAQTAGSWQFDPTVTEVGKNAERARQLVYWVFTHPPSYTVPVLAQIWSISRNIVYALFILVIALTGLFYILAKRGGSLGPIFSGISSPIFGISIPTLFFRIGILIIYVSFSYLIILGLIQTSEITSRFFIEKFQGCRLFNINFTGSPPLDCRLKDTADVSIIKELEKNYLEFIGYRDSNILNQESVTTSLFLIKITTLTYNVLAIILILRHVVLWFLLMVSPFLAILLPFIFIRNTGYIWIGVFFQWLFYGPLFSLFIAGLSQVWVKGIPYAFNFARINKPEGQVFPTAINILYGGPSQILSPTNSANYIDTYAEYIIALIMLWVAIFLPWLLLRIFRDYCCDVLRQNNAVLLSILDKIRGVGIPPAPLPTTPSSTTERGLPFRKVVKEVKEIELKKLEDVSRAQTYELTRALSLSVNTLSEVARLEMDQKENKKIVETLNRIANPYIIPSEEDRRVFSHLKKELEARAQLGDKEAQLVLAAALKKPAVVTPISLYYEHPEIAAREIIDTLTQETNLTSEKVSEILKELPQVKVENQVEVIAEKVQAPQMKVEQIINSLPKYTPKGTELTTLILENPQITKMVAERTGLTEEKIKEVFQEFSQATLTQTERIEKVSQQTKLPQEEVASVLQITSELLPQFAPEQVALISSKSEIVGKLAKETGLSEETVQNVLEKTSNLPPAKTTFEDQVEMVAEVAGLSEEKIKDILGTVAAVRLEKPEIKKPKVVRRPTISVEDYEEVKNMWVNHYKLSEVPVSEHIQNRKDWLLEDIRKLTNIIDLLTSLNPQDKEMGMKEVAQILPFLLLGGFSEVETLTYLKAKLQAAKLVLNLLEEKEKIKEEVKKEEEETLVEIPKPEVKKENKTLEEEKAFNMEVPTEEDK